MLNSKAAIYQGCTTYEQAKEILALTGGTFQIYIDGCFIPCSEYEKTCTPNTDENNNNSDTDLSDNDNEVSFNKTFIQANDVQLNDTEVGNVLTEHKIISQKLDNQISSKRENKNTPNVSSICSPKCNDLEKATTCLNTEVLSERGRIKLQLEG